MCDVAIEYHVYRVFYYNVGQGGQFGAVDKFECSDRVVLGWIRWSVTVTLLFFSVNFSPRCYACVHYVHQYPLNAYFLRVSSVNFSPGCVHYVHQYPGYPLNGFLHGGAQLCALGRALASVKDAIARN